MRPGLPVLALALAACSNPVADVGGLSEEGGSTTGTAGGGESSTHATLTVGASTGSSDADDTVDPSSASSSGEVDPDSTGPGLVLDVGSGESGGIVDDCDEDAPALIHVLTTGDEIWSFDPIAIDYQFVTAVDCPQIEGYPTGFVIDRSNLVTILSAEPFVPDFDNYPPMKLTQFHPGDLACDELFYGAIEEMGTSLDCADLSIVSMLDDPDHERLFAHSCTGGGFTIGDGFPLGSLFRMDTADAEPDFALAGTDDYSSMPLAGTGDGRLFGASGNQEVAGSTRILEFDQDTGAIVATTPVPEISLGDFGAYFALAFYGGDLYTFGLSATDGTIVTRYDWDDDDGDGEHEVTALPEAGVLPFDGGIVAAASPTCIPLTPAG